MPGNPPGRPRKIAQIPRPSLNSPPCYRIEPPEQDSVQPHRDIAQRRRPNNNDGCHYDLCTCPIARMKPHQRQCKRPGTQQSNHHRRRREVPLAPSLPPFHQKFPAVSALHRHILNLFCTKRTPLHKPPAFTPRPQTSPSACSYPTANFTCRQILSAVSEGIIPRKPPVPASTSTTTEEGASTTETPEIYSCLAQSSLLGRSWALN